MKIADQQVVIHVDGVEEFHGPWWKAWRVVLNAVADKQGEPALIRVKLLPLEKVESKPKKPRRNR